MNTRSTFDFKVTTIANPHAAVSESGALPSGVTFVDNHDGTASLTGSAAAGSAGSYPVTITANNGFGNPATQSFVLTVTTTPSVPAITSPSADTETFGGPFAFTVTTDGNPAPKVSKAGALPAGVTYKDNGDGTATIAGTPANGAIGSYPLTLTVKSSTGTSTQDFSLSITKAPVINKVPTTTGAVGSAVNIAVTSQGYNTPSVSVYYLPRGLNFIGSHNRDGTGTIVGTPAVGTDGVYTPEIVATNSLGTATQTFTLNIDEAPAFSGADAATAVVGTAFSFQATATGYPAPKFAFTGVLPTGVTFKKATGTFSGTPKKGTAGSYPLTITATNTTSTTSQSFTLTVTT